MIAFIFAISFAAFTILFFRFRRCHYAAQMPLFDMTLSLLPLSLIAAC
jgi:hypothetical protein